MRVSEAWRSGRLSQVVITDVGVDRGEYEEVLRTVMLVPPRSARTYFLVERFERVKETGEERNRKIERDEEIE